MLLDPKHTISNSRTAAGPTQLDDLMDLTEPSSSEALADT